MNKTLALLSGTLCDARLFEPVAAHFTARGWQVRIPVLHCAKPDLDVLAEQVLGSLPGRFALVGHSLGAVLAQHILRAAPQRLSHLAHLDANASADSAQARSGRERDFARGRTIGLAAFARDTLLERYLHRANLTNEALARTVAAMAQDLGLNMWRLQLDLLQTRFDAGALLGHSPVPTLLAAGADDALAPLSRLDRVAGANVTRAAYPRSGHLPTLENPPAVIASLEQLFAAAAD